MLPMLGIKPMFSGRSLADGANADFDVVMAAPDGKTLAKRGLRYDLLRVESSYQWYRQNGQWEYEPVKRTERVANGTVDVAADKPARVVAAGEMGPLSPGNLRPASRTAPITSVSFDAGFYAEANADTPDLLEVALDKPDYKPGDTMNVAVTARTAGRLTVNVFTDRLRRQPVARRQARCRAREPAASAATGGRAPIWSPRCAVRSTRRRSACRAAPSACSGSRSTRRASTLALDMKLPATMRPSSTLNVPIKLAGLTAGEEARVVVAAVDVGILNLTNYKPPAPDDYYLGQRRLTAEIRDLYGAADRRHAGRARTNPLGRRRRRGTFRLAADAGAARALFRHRHCRRATARRRCSSRFRPSPARVRVMAVAWSKDKVGKASGDVVVRDPVVLTATLPRFLRTGDRGAVQLELDNVEGAAGDYNHRRATDGAVRLATETAVGAQTCRQAARRIHPGHGRPAPTRAL